MQRDLCCMCFFPLISGWMIPYSSPLFLLHGFSASVFSLFPCFCAFLASFASCVPLYLYKYIIYTFVLPFSSYCHSCFSCLSCLSRFFAFCFRCLLLFLLFSLFWAWSQICFFAFGFCQSPTKGSKHRHNHSSSQNNSNNTVL